MKTTNPAEWKGVLVVGEINNCRVQPVTFELISKARELKESCPAVGDTAVVLIGSDLERAVTELGSSGVDEVIVVDHPAVALFNNDLYAAVLQELIMVRKPSVVLFPATSRMQDLASMLGIRANTGVAAHCVDVRINEKAEILAVVPAFGGKVLGDILCPGHRPQMATVKPGVFRATVPDTPSTAAVSVFDAAALLQAKKKTSRLVALDNSVCAMSAGIPVEAATVVVCGGWGMGSRENWQLLEELAALLGGAVGCTRPAVDEGWVAGESQMIGTSGKVVRPRVYIGAALSGSSHHVCGMKDADLIISINTDAQAPIFEVSDIRVVGDAKQILSGLIEKIRKIRSGK
jgi:electron transfer flavoprotein alpha subunit